MTKITEIDRPRKHVMNMVIPGGKDILVTTFEPENDNPLMTPALDYTLHGAFFDQLVEKLLFDRFVKKSPREATATQNGIGE